MTRRDVTTTFGVGLLTLCLAAAPANEASAFGVGFPGDLDGDGQVAFSDLTMLLAAWGPCGFCVADIDGDGEVGFTDLTILLANWT